MEPLDLLADRRRKALALNDDVVQHLAAALLALDLERVEESRQHVEIALKASQQIVSDLIRGSEDEARLGPGELASRPTVRDLGAAAFIEKGTDPSTIAATIRHAAA